MVKYNLLLLLIAPAIFGMENEKSITKEGQEIPVLQQTNSNEVDEPKEVLADQKNDSNNVNEKDKDGYTLLHLAARNGKLEALIALLAHPKIDLTLPSKTVVREDITDEKKPFYEDAREDIKYEYGDDDDLYS